jgi:hypothetical protein
MADTEVRSRARGGSPCPPPPCAQWLPAIGFGHHVDDLGERLMRFPTALGYHIEIKIGVGKASKKASKVGEVTIKDARRNAA